MRQFTDALLPWGLKCDGNYALCVQRVVENKIADQHHLKKLSTYSLAAQEENEGGELNCHCCSWSSKQLKTFNYVIAKCSPNIIFLFYVNFFLGNIVVLWQQQFVRERRWRRRENTDPDVGPVRRTVEGLLSGMWDAERLGPSDRGGVSSTVHVLVHLLRHLLRMTKVCRGDGHSAEGGEGRIKLRLVNTNVYTKVRINDINTTYCIMRTMLWTLMVCRVQ